MSEYLLYTSTYKNHIKIVKVFCTWLSVTMELLWRVVSQVKHSQAMHQMSLEYLKWKQGLPFDWRTHTHFWTCSNEVGLPWKNTWVLCLSDLFCIIQTFCASEHFLKSESNPKFIRTCASQFKDTQKTKLNHWICFFLSGVISSFFNFLYHIAFIKRHEERPLRKRIQKEVENQNVREFFMIIIAKEHKGSGIRWNSWDSYVQRI